MLGRVLGIATIGGHAHSVAVLLAEAAAVAAATSAAAGATGIYFDAKVTACPGPDSRSALTSQVSIAR